MTIYLTGPTALEFWRWHALANNALPRPERARITRLSRCDESPEDIRRACEPFHSASDPIHIACPNKRKAAGIASHAVSNLPVPGSFFRLGDAAFVASPEFALMQVIGKASPIKAVSLIYRASGTYALDEGNPRGFLDRAPLTTVRKLRDFAQAAKGQPGAAALAKAAARASDGSASPRETQTAMLLTLPCRMGGFGLPLAEVNKRIQLDRAQQRIVGKMFLKVDLYWSRPHIALEYDSDEFHSAYQDISRDSRRRNMLESMGIGVVTMTNDELKSPASCELIAKRLSKKMGRQMQIRVADHVQKQLALRRELGIGRSAM